MTKSEFDILSETIKAHDVSFKSMGVNRCFWLIDLNGTKAILVRDNLAKDRNKRYRLIDRMTASEDYGIAFD